MIQIAIRVTLADGRYSTIRADVCEGDLATVAGVNAVRETLNVRLARALGFARDCLPGGWACGEPARTAELSAATDADGAAVRERTPEDRGRRGAG